MKFPVLPLPVLLLLDKTRCFHGRGRTHTFFVTSTQKLLRGNNYVTVRDSAANGCVSGNGSGWSVGVLGTCLTHSIASRDTVRSENCRLGDSPPKNVRFHRRMNIPPPKNAVSTEECPSGWTSFGGNRHSSVEMDILRWQGDVRSSVILTQNLLASDLIVTMSFAKFG